MTEHDSPGPPRDDGAQDVRLHLRCKGCMDALVQLGRARGEGDMARQREIKALIRRHPDH